MPLAGCALQAVTPGGTATCVVGSGLNVTGSPYSFTATYADGAVYPVYPASAASPALSASVTPAPLTVTATGQSKVYGQATLTLTPGYLASGFVNGDTPITTLTGSVAMSVTAFGPVVVGGYPISQGILAANANAALAFTTAVLTITGAPSPSVQGQTANFASGDANYIAANKTTMQTVQALSVTALNDGDSRHGR